jgi:DNA helicase-2/ATP-dependent DNA helicase PcrA
LLDHSTPPWRLDRRESTKYRRGKGKILIVNHGAAAGGSRPGEDETDRVRLMTLHKAKGLEFPHVFLLAWGEAGVFPSDYGDADEERRLAYVALTRGMRRVSIFYCGFRRGFGAPSLFHR